MMRATNDECMENPEMQKTELSHLHDIEDSILAPYASKSKLSRGRAYSESQHAYRTEFQRDRERIIHSRAFRRLEYKTQVFVNHEGDHYRTRLTHSIEVSQIARSIARALHLNEDLAESIALAHDLGHTPFGHAGERELNALMSGAGGFEHNRQSLRVVEKLEERYNDFPGLNLTWETREELSSILRVSTIPQFQTMRHMSSRLLRRRSSILPMRSRTTTTTSTTASRLDCSK